MTPGWARWPGTGSTLCLTRRSNIEKKKKNFMAPSCNCAVLGGPPPPPPARRADQRGGGEPE
jgi:hypothetical protein